jgi:hypothetical protein
MGNKEDKIILISDIHCDQTKVQARVAMSEQTIDEYVEAMQSGVTFQPVVVFYDGKKYILADGFHRVEAAKKSGMTEIDADVRNGGMRDALLFAVGANADHGLRRTNQDKRRAVEILLKDDEWSEWSNVIIAKSCAVSEALVRKVRVSIGGMSGVSSNFERNEVKYKDKHGIDRSMKASNIGKPSLPAGEDRSASPSIGDGQTVTSPPIDEIALPAQTATEPEELFGVLYADFRLIGDKPIPATDDAVVFLRVDPLEVPNAVTQLVEQGFVYVDQAILEGETGRTGKWFTPQHTPLLVFVNGEGVERPIDPIPSVIPDDDAHIDLMKLYFRNHDDIGILGEDGWNRFHMPEDVDALALSEGEGGFET